MLAVVPALMRVPVKTPSVNVHKLSGMLSAKSIGCACRKFATH